VFVKSGIATISCRSHQRADAHARAARTIGEGERRTRRPAERRARAYSTSPAMDGRRSLPRQRAASVFLVTPGDEAGGAGAARPWDLEPKIDGHLTRVRLRLDRLSPPTRRAGCNRARERLSDICFPTLWGRKDARRIRGDAQADLGQRMGRPGAGVAGDGERGEEGRR